MTKFRIILLLILSLSIISCDKNKPEDVNKKEEEKPVVEKPFTRQIGTFSNVEYRTGNYPLIISVPHGGKETPSSMIPRTKENCGGDPNFTTVYDSYTPELSEAIDQAVYSLTGKHPYFVKMNIKRTLIDANRKPEYAYPAESSDAAYVYSVYYNKIKEAKEEITKEFGSGLIIDIHAHAHDIQEIEVGYQIGKANMLLTDEELNAANLAKKTGIYNLIMKNKQKQSFAQHIRGKYSFGDMLRDFGLPSVPNSTNKYPQQDKYLSGGYITSSQGSGKGGTIDAIQLEFNRDCKKEEGPRKATAEAVAKTVKKYFETHYTFSKEL